LKSFLNGFSSNQHIAQKLLSEMYTSHFEHVWSSTFQQQQKTDSQHITKYFVIKTFHLYQVVSFERLITAQALVAWTYSPFFSNFLFTNFFHWIGQYNQN